MIPQFRNGRGYALALAEGEELAPTLYLYDILGVDLFGGIAAKQVVDDLAAMGTVPALDVRVNSPGGDVFEGIAVYNALARFPGTVTVYVDGLAASIASLIAMAGDKTVVAENAMYMVHRPWTVVAGDAEEMRRQADTLEKAWSAMLATYSRRTGRSPEALEKSVASAGGEWWMSAEDAVEEGFADEVEEPTKMAAVFGLRHFRKVPERLAARVVEDTSGFVPPTRPRVAEIEPPRVTREPQAVAAEPDDALELAEQGGEVGGTEEAVESDDAELDAEPPPEPPSASTQAPAIETTADEPPALPTPSPTAGAARRRRIVEVLRLRA